MEDEAEQITTHSIRKDTETRAELPPSPGTVPRVHYGRKRRKKWICPTEMENF